MKKFLFVICSLIFAGNAFAEDLTCNVMANLDEVARVDFTLNSNEQTKYAFSEVFSFFVTNKGHGKFELEIYNNNGPTRSYAEGYLRNSEDTLTWTMWTRDILLSTECRLIQKGE